MRPSALLTLCVLLTAAPAPAATITLSGTVSYDGSSVGDTLYVAVLDTTGVEDVTLLDVEAIAVGTPPFAQPYSLQFDNAGVAAELIIASFLDVDGGGVADIQAVDVFGWYDGQQLPQSVSSASSQAGLDFALPTAELRGEIAFGAGQSEARINLAPGSDCLVEGFRPGGEFTSPGAYTIVGIYAGTYCLSAEGSGSFGYTRVCYQDPGCDSPVLIDIDEGEVVTGADLDFSAVGTAQQSWGTLKSGGD